MTDPDLIERLSELERGAADLVLLLHDSVGNTKVANERAADFERKAHEAAQALKAKDAEIAELRDRNEVAYLIEMKGPSGEPVYYGKTETGLDWTADANAAVRYARREDAQAVIDDIGWTEPSPVEHMWVEPSARKALGGSDND